MEEEDRPDSWDRIVELFHGALQRPEEERDAWIREQCGDDPVLHRQVSKLLEVESSAQDFLETSRLKIEEVLTPSLSPDTVVGDLRIVRLLGSGGFGEVYLARQESLQREVAVKFLKAKSIEPSDLAKFQGEARSVASIRHPGIVGVHLIAEWEDRPYFVMDYVPGPSLQAFLQEMREERARRPEAPASHPMQAEGESYPNLVARIVLEVAEALEASHDAGLIHRDVKPANILLDEQGRARLVDFGIAKRLEESAQSSQIVGSLVYMSPEQARIRSRPVDRRTDIYSLGVVLYELLTLTAPFREKTREETLVAIRERYPVPPRRLAPETPEPLERICRKAIRKHPNHRYASAREFAADLRAYLDGKEPAARSFELGERIHYAMVRWPRTWKVLALLLVILATLAVRSCFVSPANTARVLVVTRPENAEVYALPLNTHSGLPLPDVEPIALGSSGQWHAVEAGFYRFVAMGADGAFGEVDELLQAGDETRLPLLGLSTVEEVAQGMVAIEAGTYRLPRATKGYNSLEAETLHPGYRIDDDEVSNAEYRAFCEATERSLPERWPADWDPVWDALPVTGVTFHDAQAYAAWAGKRLPAFVEWDRAARGPDGHPGVWGEALPQNLAELCNIGNAPKKETEEGEEIEIEPEETEEERRVREWEEYVTRALPCGRETGDVRDGVRDLYGNVGEWTSTPFSILGEEGVTSPSPVDRIVRGFSWRKRLDRDLSLKFFGWHHRRSTDLLTGFRCVKSQNPLAR